MRHKVAAVSARSRAPSGIEWDFGPIFRSSTGNDLFVFSIFFMIAWTIARLVCIPPLLFPLHHPHVHTNGHAYALDTIPYHIIRYHTLRPLMK